MKETSEWDVADKVYLLNYYFVRVAADSAYDFSITGRMAGLRRARRLCGREGKVISGQGIIGRLLPMSL